MNDQRGLRSRFVIITLGLALALRVGVVLIAMRTAELLSNDGVYYMMLAQSPDLIAGYNASAGPVYPLFLIPFLRLFPAPVPQIVAVRLVQMLFDVVLVYVVYRITAHLFNEKAGRVALIAQAADPRYILAAGAIATETLFLMLFAAFVLFYFRGAGERRPQHIVAAVLLLVLSLLTRPIPLLFPLLLVGHLWLISKNRRRITQGAALTLGLTALLVTPWIILQSIRHNEFVPISKTVCVHLWRASRPDGHELNSAELLAEAAREDMGYGVDDPHNDCGDYFAAAARNIFEEPGAWTSRIVRETAGAYLQPYGTVFFTPRGASVKQTFSAFLSGQASLWDVLAVPGFWRKVLIYIWHYWGLIGGFAGLWLAARKKWKEILPLVAWVIYLTAITAPLLIEPRYVFPVMFAFTIFAAYATARVWQALTARGLLPHFLHASASSAAAE